MKNLMDKNKNAYQYQEAIEIQFQSICEPLYNLEIKWFGYIKIFPDGSYLNLSPSNKEFIRKYFSTINYQGITPTQEIGSSLFGKSHYAMYASDTLLQNEMKDPILSLAYFYNIWPVFCIYKNSSYFMEVYCFSKNNKDHYSTNFYLNNLDIFENFCDYFDVCAKDIINCTDKNKLGYFDQQFNFKNQSEENFRSQQIKKFLQETYITTKESDLLSSREVLEGANYLALGEGVKGISGNLGIPSLFIENSLQAHKEFSKTGINNPDASNQILTAKSAQVSSSIPSLSPRQKECLLFLTRGKTAKQIGQILGISHRTVETHIISLKSKMGCTTKNQLIGKIFDMNKIILR